MSKDFLDDVDWFTDKFGGERQTDDEIVQKFALQGPETRIALIHRIENDDDGGEIGGGSESLRKAARRYRVARRFNDVHALALKVNK